MDSWVKWLGIAGAGGFAVGLGLLFVLTRGGR